ncbi:MAG: ECF transporter S component [Promethearchaeota archaeon]
MNDVESPPTEYKSETTGKQVDSAKMVSMTAIFSALIAVFTLISFEQLPDPLSTINFAPIIVYTVGVMFKPKRAFLISSLGNFIGEWLRVVLAGEAAFLFVYLIGVVVARGFEAFLISLLREKNEVGAMVAGCVWEYLGFLTVGSVYFILIAPIPGVSAIAVVGWYTGTLIDLVFIPVSVALNKAIRAGFNVKYLDELLGGVPR